MFSATRPSQVRSQAGFSRVPQQGGIAPPLTRAPHARILVWSCPARWAQAAGGASRGPLCSNRSMGGGSGR